MRREKFTPGPWSWCASDREILWGMGGVQVISDYGYEGLSFSGSDQSDANKTLIAQAPALYDLLTIAVRWAEQQGKEPDWLWLAREVLNKAAPKDDTA